jgi:molecular chaperone DnaK (HSP70)
MATALEGSYVVLLHLSIYSDMRYTEIRASRSERARETHTYMTRAEYNALIAPDVARAVELTRRALTPDMIESSRVVLYLTGGSSNTPLVHAELAKVCTIGTLAADPKTVVAFG